MVDVLLSCHCYSDCNNFTTFEIIHSSSDVPELVQDERMHGMMEDIRGKFKAVAAMLGVLEDYFPCQSTSTAESLSF